MYEVGLDDAVESLREMRSNYENYARRAPEARAFIKKEYSLESISQKLSSTLMKLGFD